MKEIPIAEIPLTQGMFSIVDQFMIQELSKYKWYYNNGYAFARMQIDGKARPVSMHAYIAKTPKGFHTHHINHNTLDNRSCNLQVCTPRENILARRDYFADQNPFYGKRHSREFREHISKINSIPVIQVSREGNIVAVHASSLAAERTTGVSNGNISEVIHGKRKTAGGFIWKHA